MAEAFDWPHLIGRILMSALIVGLPLVLTLAWYHGHKGLKRVSAGETYIIALLILIGAGLLLVLVRSPSEHPGKRIVPPASASITAATAPIAATRAPVELQPTSAGISLAVLPFADMSPQHDQEYFSDGLSEELLNQLAQIRDLRVAGRTSSFSFKGKNEDLVVIGAKLRVNHSLEGSVRKSGKDLRITAQLINAADGSHVWSQTYDRKLESVFAVQEEIAKDVAAALSVTLGVGQSLQLAGGTTNVEAYGKFLAARAISERGSGADWEQAAQLYRDALALDPKFARAWSGLYVALGVVDYFFLEKKSSLTKEVAQARDRMLALAPDAWWTQALLAREFESQRRWSEAETLASAALAHAPPSEIDVLDPYADLMAAVGRMKEALDYFRRSRDADRLSLLRSGRYQTGLTNAGFSAEADAEYARSKELGENQILDWLVVMRYMQRGDAQPGSLKARIQAFAARWPGQVVVQLPTPVTQLDDKSAALVAIRAAAENPATGDAQRLEDLAAFADFYGAKDLALSLLQRAAALKVGSVFVWQPFRTGLRSDPRFKQIIRDLKLDQYWRKSGKWADFCHSTGNDDFECQ